MRTEIGEYIRATKSTMDRALLAPELLKGIEYAARECVKALKNNNKILLCGNGGSAADAQHIAAELTGRFGYKRPPLAAIALTTDTSALTAIGNDYGFDRIFSRQVEALGEPGDVLIAISTSGKSSNILLALGVAKLAGLVSIGMAGQSGGDMAANCHVLLKAPSLETPHIQECHIMFGHLICKLIEDTLFGEAYGSKK